MLIRKRILTISVIIAFSSILLSCILFNVFLQQNLLQFEKDAIRKDLQRITSILQYDVTMLKNFVEDWATWNDTYDFVQDYNEKYTEDNLGNDTFSMQRLNFMLYLDKTGDIMYSRWFDLTANQEMSVDPRLQQEITELVRSRSTRISGVVRTSKGLMMIAAAPILDSKKQKPSEGTFVAGRFLDAEKFADLLRVPIQITSADEGEDQPAFTVSQVMYDAMIPLVLTDNETITARILLKDMSGKAAFWLRTENARDIYHDGLKLVLLLLMLVCGIGLVLGAIAYWLNNKYVVRRLESLAEEIGGIRSFAEMPAAFKLQGNDEITKIAHKITGMLQELKSSHDRLQYLSDHDVLTTLNNRTYFEKYINYLKQQGAGQNIGVIMCDLDGLKLANDMFGHEYGDMLLKNFAAILEKVCPDSLLKARVGGDEFIILLENEGNAVIAACENIKREIEVSQFSGMGGLSVSIGFECDAQQMNIRDKIKKADNQMYREKLHRTQSRSSELVHMLRSALEARDYITEGHAHRVGELALLLAAKVGLPQKDMADLMLFAEFHDVGKIGVADQILFKKGPLTLEERQEMNKHCEIGYRIAKSTPALSPIAELILRHHERFDGEGHPLRLKEYEIPVACRILGIVDAFDAMTNDRPYRAAMSKEQAVAELRACSGTQFDPDLVEMFIKIIK